MTYVYIIQRGKGSVKIGMSNDPDKRLQALQTANHERLRIVAKFIFNTRDEAIEFESFLHHKFRDYRLSGEWFKKGILRKFPKQVNVSKDESAAELTYMSKHLDRMLKNPPKKHLRRVGLKE